MDSEILEIFTTDGKPAGYKERSLVHRDGDWHKTALCFMSYKEANGKHCLIFQRRSSGKDLYANKIGATIGGHCQIGKTPDEIVLNELNEELNIKASSCPIILLCIKSHKYIFPDTEKKDCEIQYIYHLSVDIEEMREKLRINQKEASKLISIELEDMLRIFSNKQTHIQAHLLMSLGKVINSKERKIFPVTKSDFVPFKDSYYIDILRRIKSIIQS